MDPEEYTVSDTTSDMSQNVEEFTDVQKTKEGDADVSIIEWAKSRIDLEYIVIL